MVSYWSIRCTAAVYAEEPQARQVLPPDGPKERSRSVRDQFATHDGPPQECPDAQRRTAEEPCVGPGGPCQVVTNVLLRLRQRADYYHVVVPTVPMFPPCK